jgi:hypothetical protein
VRLKGSWFEASLAKKIFEMSSQPTPEYGGACLSSQLCGRIMVPIQPRQKKFTKSPFQPIARFGDKHLSS